MRGDEGTPDGGEGVPAEIEGAQVEAQEAATAPEAADPARAGPAPHGEAGGGAARVDPSQATRAPPQRARGAERAGAAPGAQAPAAAEPARVARAPAQAARAAPAASARGRRAGEDPPLRVRPADAAADDPASAAEGAAAAAPARVRAVRRASGSPLELELHGRVSVAMGADERDAWARDLGMRDARIGLEARLGAVLTVVEADLSARSLLRDAFVRLDGPAATRLQAGHFKAPFSARRLESSWRLPLVRRGLVNDYVVERNAIGGRRFGATGGLRPWGGRLELAAGAFVGPAGSADQEDERRAEDLAARLALRPWRGVELGATAYRAARDERPAREAATAYLSLDLGPLEATVEGLAGHLLQGSFAAGTAFVGWTFRPGGGALRVTPVAGAEVLALRDGASGRGEAATVGAVLSWADGLKVKVEGERARRPGDEVPANAVALEIATRF